MTAFRSYRWSRSLAVLVGLCLAGVASIAVPAVADPSSAQWAALRQCESGDNYTVVSANGLYYGAYQFNLDTWRSVGGSGYPNQASPAEQDYRALYLYRMRGWQPWTCTRILGLRPDADAASGVVPARPADVAPTWPGVVYADGDCAAALRTWQLRLNGYGFHFADPGCYRADTLVAVAAVQAVNGLAPDGLLGLNTWRAAWEGRAPTSA